jgi:hypothetical protein
MEWRRKWLSQWLLRLFWLSLLAKRIWIELAESKRRSLPYYLHGSNARYGEA